MCQKIHFLNGSANYYPRQCKIKLLYVQDSRLFSSDEDTKHTLHIGIHYLGNPHKINSSKSQKLYCYKLHLFSAMTLWQNCTLSTTSMCLALGNTTVHIQYALTNAHSTGKIFVQRFHKSMRESNKNKHIKTEEVK